MGDCFALVKVLCAAFNKVLAVDTVFSVVAKALRVIFLLIAMWFLRCLK